MLLVTSVLFSILFLLTGNGSAQMTSNSISNSTEQSAATIESITHNVNSNPTSLPHECSADEKNFIYTPCDKNGNRWKVEVPKQTGQCFISKPMPPDAGINCTSTCSPGQFLDIKSQACKDCPAGTYSVGDSKIISIKTELPEGFETYGDSDSGSDDACLHAGWNIRDGYLASNGSSCKSVLKYQVRLAKAGKIIFSTMSREESTSFHVWVDNGLLCREQDEMRLSSMKSEKTTDRYYTLSNKWERHALDMEKGENTVNFVASHFFNIYSHKQASSDYKTDSENAVLVKDITVKGFAYSLECKKCDAGYFSKPGSSICEPCKANTFSAASAGVCETCGSDEYSEPGASKCIARRVCTENDYHHYWEPCKDSKTSMKYKWNEPQICKIDPNKPLPAPGVSRDCPPCNPGLEFNGTTCVFCPADSYNDGSEKCRKCSPNTAPSPGLFYKFWTQYPNKPMLLYCLAKPDDGCKTKKGWVLRDSYISSGIGHSDDSELLMYIYVNEFTKSKSTFKIDFEITACPSGNCRLKIETISSGRVTEELGSYEGNQRRSTREFSRYVDGTTKYRMLFEKRYDEEKQTFHYLTAELKIYSIDITNVKNGGSSICEPCASNGRNCVKCKEGFYISEERKECTACPANTFMEAFNDNPIGIKSCKPCPHGTKSSAGSLKCYSDCMVTIGEGKDAREYNFTALEGTHFVKGPFLFTSKGYKFFHGFSVSMCGHVGLQSTCNDNSTSKEHKSLHAAICRNTFIPDENKLIATQPISIGEQLLHIHGGDVTTSHMNNQTRELNAKPEAVKFHFHAFRITEACKKGSSGVVSLVCDPNSSGRGHIVLGNDNCSYATCDGCNYKFTLKSRYACAKCTEADYEVITTSCVKGVKYTRYLWKSNSACVGGVTKPTDKSHKCTIFDKSILDFKMVIMGFLLGAVLLASIVVVLCYRNRSLNYKYSRLIDASQMKDGELPASEKCALDDDDDDEDEVILARGKGKSRFLDRLKGKKKTDNFSEFETINLDATKAAFSEDDEI